MGGYGSRRVWGCEKCCEEAYAEERKKRPLTFKAAIRNITGKGPHLRWTRCAECGRDILLITDTSYKKPPARGVCCSEACRSEHRKRPAREKRRVGLEKVCGECGKQFTASRSDAKTCSPACKQKAYRRKRKVG
jgi:hypothetical protein